MSKFNGGDRVKAVGSATLYRHNIGREGVVTEVDSDGDIYVTFSCGETDYGEEADFQLLPPAVNTDSLKAALQSLHEQFRTAGNTVPALALEEVISEHFGVTWQEPQEGRWVEKEGAA